jgi:hypothetical protein
MNKLMFFDIPSLPYFSWSASFEIFSALPGISSGASSDEE